MQTIWLYYSHSSVGPKTAQRYAEKTWNSCLKDIVVTSSLLTVADNVLMFNLLLFDWSQLKCKLLSVSMVYMSLKDKLPIQTLQEQTQMSLMQHIEKIFSCTFYVGLQACWQWMYVLPHCYDMMTFTKPEVHNILHCWSLEEYRATTSVSINMHRKFREVAWIWDTPAQRRRTHTLYNVTV